MADPRAFEALATMPTGGTQKRCVLWLSGTVQTSDRSFLSIATGGEGRHMIQVDKGTLFCRGGRVLERQGRLRPATPVRVAFVRCDQGDLAVVIQVLAPARLETARSRRPHQAFAGVHPASEAAGTVPAGGG